MALSVARGSAVIAPKTWAAMVPVRSYGRADADGNLSHVEVRRDPVTGALVQVTRPMAHTAPPKR